MSGRVTSPKPGCTRNKVVLYRARPGDDQRYARDFTDSRGRWEIRPRTGKFFQKGRYYAVAPRKRLVLSDAHNHVCARVETGKVSVGA